MNQCLHKKATVIGTLTSVVAISGLLIAARPAPSYVAHEWGTFTSVQGGDGVLLDWCPLETSRLPKFVYDWKRPGPGQQPPVFLGKNVLVARQRMETPVIYFYSEGDQTVDVSVDFPQGRITEWYPRALVSGPSSVPVSKQSRARWTHIEILPEKQNQALASSLPLDNSGSHYFAARDTDSDYVKVVSSGSTKVSPEQEKFIFYRGVGDFSTPLQVTMAADNAAVLENTSKETIENLLVLRSANGAGELIPVARLAVGERLDVAFNASTSPTPAGALSRKLAGTMTEALVKAGLYRREAVAMVKTWEDSWFQEEGVRVLYVLPRAWTDRTLPLTLTPAPRELVRVMVGRAEVITPAVQQRLAGALTKASQGDTSARLEAMAEFRRLGRFGEPAWRLATNGASPEVSQTGWAILQEATVKPATVTRAF